MQNEAEELSRLNAKLAELCSLYGTKKAISVVNYLASLAGIFKSLTEEEVTGDLFPHFLSVISEGRRERSWCIEDDLYARSIEWVHKMETNWPGITDGGIQIDEDGHATIGAKASGIS